MLEQNVDLAWSTHGKLKGQQRDKIYQGTGCSVATRSRKNAGNVFTVFGPWNTAEGAKALHDTGSALEKAMPLPAVAHLVTLTRWMMCNEIKFFFLTHRWASGPAFSACIPPGTRPGFFSMQSAGCVGGRQDLPPIHRRPFASSIPTAAVPKRKRKRSRSAIAMTMIGKNSRWKSEMANCIGK